jgi:hypothetical protein
MVPCSGPEAASEIDELVLLASVRNVLGRPGSAALDDEDAETASLAVVLLSRTIFEGMPTTGCPDHPALLVFERGGEIMIAWEGGGRPVALDGIVAKCADACGASGVLGRRMTGSLPGAMRCGRFALPGFELAWSVSDGTAWRIKPRGI